MVMEFVLIPAGEFMMGSPSGESGRDGDEGPVHKVRITQAFYMGKYEVTQAQWQQVTGTSPWSGKGYAKPNPRHAVSYVSWNDCQGFLGKLKSNTGVGVFALPTEAQWEYACRSGTRTRFSFGDSESQLGDYAWYDGNAHSKGEDYAHGVGMKRANPWGLYDMHGNVWEWCFDGKRSYSASSETDPRGSQSGSRVLRGGSWDNSARRVRSAYRYVNFPSYSFNYFFGFRVLSVVPLGR